MRRIVIALSFIFFAIAGVLVYNFVAPSKPEIAPQIQETKPTGKVEIVKVRDEAPSSLRSAGAEADSADSERAGSALKADGEPASTHKIEAPAPPPVSNVAEDSEKNKNQRVYITKSGKCFHLKGCRSLRSGSKITAMKRSEAVAKGRRPCKVCKP